MKYKVSIIIPVFNVENYIKTALDSIINQTMNLNEIQVIIVNDASTDSSEKIIIEYCKKYDNFEAIHLKNNSGSAATPRNTGLNYVKSEYVMFLDPDDEYEHDYCEVMYNTITKYNLNLVKSNYKTVTDNVESKNYYFDKNINEKIINSKNLPLKYVAIWNGIHKYDFLIKNEIYFPPKSFGEDIFFSVKEFLCIDKFLYLNHYFGYKYHYRELSHAKSPSIENIYNILKVFYITADLCKEFNREDVANFVLGTQITGIYYRIVKVNKFNTRIKLLENVYDYIQTSPNLILPGLTYKISHILLSKHLIYLTNFYLTILKYFKNSKFIKKIYEFILNRLS